MIDEPVQRESSSLQNEGNDRLNQILEKHIEEDTDEDEMMHEKYAGEDDLRQSIVRSYSGDSESLNSSFDDNDDELLNNSYRNNKTSKH